MTLITRCRVWDGKRMGEVLRLSMENGSIFGAEAHFPGENISEAVWGDEIKFMWCMESRDITGKLMYEGDIVQIPMEDGTYAKYVIIFDKIPRTMSNGACVEITGFGFAILSREEEVKFPIIDNYLGCNDTEIMVVCGNIYQHKDLIP